MLYHINVSKVHLSIVNLYPNPKQDLNDLQKSSLDMHVGHSVPQGLENRWF